MELKKLPKGLFARKLLGSSGPEDEQLFRQLTENDPALLAEFKQMQKIWNMAEDISVFSKIDKNEDWKLVTDRLSTYSVNYKRLPLGLYFVRIAALVLLTCGLTYGFYKLLLSANNTEESGETSVFSTYRTDVSKKDILLPDGSKVTLNVSSDLAYRDGFGKDSRDVILNGEAFFHVRPNPNLPFRVFTGESVIEVTGTSFSVYQEGNQVRVAVLTGTVLVASSDNLNRKVRLTANQSALVTADEEIKVAESIPVNVLSWKTGHLIFDNIPIDSALIDIARHFRRNLDIKEGVSERITAEFQDQPLREILEELELVAGLNFDTTGTALIVRK